MQGRRAVGAQPGLLLRARHHDHLRLAYLSTISNQTLAIAGSWSVCELWSRPQGSRVRVCRRVRSPHRQSLWCRTRRGACSRSRSTRAWCVPCELACRATGPACVQAYLPRAHGVGFGALAARKQRVCGAFRGWRVAGLGRAARRWAEGGECGYRRVPELQEVRLRPSVARASHHASSCCRASSLRGERGAPVPSELRYACSKPLRSWRRRPARPRSTQSTRLMGVPVSEGARRASQRSTCRH